MKRQARLYSLFRRNRAEAKIRWERLTTAAYKKDVAVRVFQNILISGAFHPEYEFRLRVVD